MTAALVALLALGWAATLAALGVVALRLGRVEARLERVEAVTRVRELLH